MVAIFCMNPEEEREQQQQKKTRTCAFVLLPLPSHFLALPCSAQGKYTPKKDLVGKLW